MINLPQTEQLINALVKWNNDNNNYDQIKSGWKNFSFLPEQFSTNDIKVTMRKDLNNHSHSCYKWFRNLIIPKINVVLKSNTESITSGTSYMENFEDIYAVFSCYKYHENTSYNVQQVPMKGQVVSHFSLNQKTMKKKQFNQLKLLQTNSKNLQFSQSHIQNRKIFYCISITICKMENHQVTQELTTSLLMPILVENRKKSLQNRTNKYMKFVEFLPIEFTRKLMLPQQENKDDNVFKYCIENHIKNEIQNNQIDDYSKNSSDSLPIDSSFNNFGSFHLKEGQQMNEENNNSSSEDNQGKKKLKKINPIGDMIDEQAVVDLENIALSDDLISALIYLSSKTIRHKIHHPLFLSNRFSQAFDLRVKSNLISSNDLQKTLVAIQEILLNSIFSQKKDDKSSDDLSFKNQPICLLIKPQFKKQSLNSIFDHKISSQIANYLECIQTNEGLFVGFEEQVENIKDYSQINFQQMDYKNCYDELSRIPIKLQQNVDLKNQKDNCSHYEIKINPIFKEGFKNYEEEGMNIYRTIVNCRINDNDTRVKMQKIKLTGQCSSDEESHNFFHAKFNINKNQLSNNIYENIHNINFNNQNSNQNQYSRTKSSINQNTTSDDESVESNKTVIPNFNQNNQKKQQININLQSSENQLYTQLSNNQQTTNISTINKSSSYKSQQNEFIVPVSEIEMEINQQNSDPINFNEIGINEKNQLKSIQIESQPTDIQSNSNQNQQESNGFPNQSQNQENKNTDSNNQFNQQNYNAQNMMNQFSQNQFGYFPSPYFQNMCNPFMMNNGNFQFTPVQNNNQNSNNTSNNTSNNQNDQQSQIVGYFTIPLYTHNLPQQFQQYFQPQQQKQVIQ